jgi:hypothetical protein
MNAVTITTNNHWRPFKYREEVPEKILEQDYGWLHESVIDGFFKYRGEWYHTEEFTRVYQEVVQFEGWDGYHAHTYHSGVVIRISDDGEMYQVGSYFASEVF